MNIFASARAFFPPILGHARIIVFMGVPYAGWYSSARRRGEIGKLCSRIDTNPSTSGNRVGESSATMEEIIPVTMLQRVNSIDPDHIKTVPN